MTEHGEEAAIAAVNRVRSGGVAGFFCREEFEVVVDPDGEATRVERRPDDAEPVLDLADDGDEAQPDDDGNWPDDDGDHDEERFEDRRRQPADDEPSVFAGPVAPGSDGSRERFLALLERRLEEASATEIELGLRRALSPEPGDATPTPPAPSQLTATAAQSSSVAESGRDHIVAPTGPKPAFWRALERTREELDCFLPTGSPLTAVVGPLPLAATVVNRLRASTELATVVVVLTDRAGIVSEPSWQLIRTGDRLIRHLAESESEAESAVGSEPEGTGPATILVIDVPVDLPHWVGPLQRRLRSAGVGLFRYAVDGEPSGADLERYRQGSDVPYAIDLTSRVAAGRVVELVAEGHPVVSVAGVDLGSELLLAMRRHVGGTGSSFEPVTDG